jgi:hypothetical protein
VNHMSLHCRRRCVSSVHILAQRKWKKLHPLRLPHSTNHLTSTTPLTRDCILLHSPLLPPEIHNIPALLLAHQLPQLHTLPLSSPLLVNLPLHL